MRWVSDDGGRLAAGFDGKAGDCVTRAVAIASGLAYADVYAALAAINQATRVKSSCAGKKSARNGVCTRSAGFKAFMADLGWVYVPCMTIGSGCKVHLADGELPMGCLIVQVSKHYTAVIDGVIHDTHDPSRDGKRCVYGYWK